MNREALIRVFSKHSVAEVEPNGANLIEREFGGRKYEELRKSRGFKHEFGLVRGARERLDRLLDPKLGLSDEDQLHQCLEIELQQKEGGSEVFKVLQELIPEVLKARWPKDLQALYDAKHEVLFEWKHYFLSYTTRKAGRTNQQFKPLIQNYYAFYPKTAERTKYNYVARILDSMLRDENLSGFFDLDEIKSGDEIQDKIFGFCRKTCGFIQLQEKATFSGARGEKNWCLEEYCEFKNNPLVKTLCKDKVPHRHHFLFTFTDPHKPAKWPEGEAERYQDWWDHAQRVKHISIAGAKVSDLEDEVGRIALVIADLRVNMVKKVMSR